MKFWWKWKYDYDDDDGDNDDNDIYDNENANTTLQKLLGCTTYFTVRLLIDGKYHNCCREFISFMFDWFSGYNNNKLQENIPVIFTILSVF